MAELQVSRLWRHGQDWLKSTPKLDNTDKPTEIPEDLLQKLKVCIKKHNLAATEVKHTTGEIIDYQRFSCFRRLVRVTAYVLRAIKDV